MWGSARLASTNSWRQESSARRRAGLACHRNGLPCGCGSAWYRTSDLAKSKNHQTSWIYHAAMQTKKEMPQVQIEYRFKFSVQHLWTSFQRYTQQIWWIRPLFKIRWPLALSCVLALGILAQKALGLAIFLGCLFVLGLLLAGWPPSLSIWILRRRFQKSPFYNDQITLSLLESGAHVLGRDSELRIGWANFTKARRFSDGLMLFQGPNVFNWLPDTAATAEGIAAAQKLARSQVPDYREI